MCYIMAVKRLKKPDAKCESGIKKILLQKINGNKDGFYLANYDEAIRTMDIKEAKEKLDSMQLHNFLCHFRIATEGRQEVDNVQGWTKNHYTFMHNGSFGGYYEKGKMPKEYDKSDSRRFFEELTKNLEANKSNKDKNIAKVIQQTIYNTTSFWGRCLLYHSTTDRLFMFGDFYLYAIGESHLVISSADLNLDLDDELKTLNGFDFKFKSANNIGIAKFDGIGVITNYAKANFHFRKLQEVYKPFEEDMVKVFGSDGTEFHVPNTPKVNYYTK